MSWFIVFGTLFTGVFLGYMLGKDIGFDEGRVVGIAEEYKAGQGR